MQQTLYVANVSLGTPAQDFSLSLDTGSSDLWVNSASLQACQRRSSPCSGSGTYDANSSSTYKYLTSDFNVSYVDGSYAAGDYVTDTLNIGGQTLNAFQFGVGYDSTSPQGILGIGYLSNEGEVIRNNKKAYANLPQALVDAKFIQANVYSLWLDDLQASTGSILFGGVDTDKYTGQLNSLPTQKDTNQYRNFIVTLTSLSLTANGKEQSLTTDLPTAMILDSGSSLTYLPNAMVGAIYETLNVQYSQREQAAFVNCGLANEDILLNFTFTAPTISIPISELVISFGEEDGTQQTFSNGNSLCAFGIAPAEGSTAVLGDTFLRSAYVVFDLENNEISLAQTNFDSSTSNIQTIGSGTVAVPGASDVASPVQAAVSQTGGSRVAGVTGSAASNASKNDTSSPWVPYNLVILFGAVAILFSCA